MATTAAAGIGTGDYVPGYFELLEISIGELPVERGLIGAGKIRRQIEVLDSRTPALGAKVVARASVDPEFKKRFTRQRSRWMRGTWDQLL